MLRSRLFWRLYGGFLAVTAVTMGVLWGVASSRVRADTLDDLRESLLSRAAVVERARHRFAPPRGEEFASFLRDAGAATETRFTIVAADGRVLADSHEMPADMEDHGARPEIREARDTARPASTTRFSRTLRADLLYLCLPPGPDGAVVRAAMPVDAVGTRLSQMTFHLLAATMAAALVSLVLGALLFRGIASPLRTMAAAAKSVADGASVFSPVPTSAGEVRDLGEAIRTMATLLRQRLDALTEERNRLGAILGSMREGVVAVDREQNIVHLNQVAADFLGLDPTHCAGRPLWELLRLPEIEDALSQVLARPSEVTREARLPKGLRERVLMFHAGPLRDAQGLVAGAVLVMHDVSILRRLETVRRDFVANVSHELKTPLTALRGYAETLLDAPDLDDETRLRFLTRIKDQTLRLSAIVTDLLTLSRVESEGATLERREIDLRDPLLDCARRFSSFAPERGLAFSATLPPAAVAILGDEEALRQAADNLLDNAFKFTPSGGQVTLTLSIADGAAIIAVADTGIGIAPEHLDRIFERFYRVDKARSRALGGTGLGLSIVKHIAERHGGTVSVESRPGAGSTFRVTIPLAPAD